MTDITPTPSRQNGTDRGARMGRGDRRRVASVDGEWRSGHTATRRIAATEKRISLGVFERPRQDSNLRTRLRRPLLYPLSYGGFRAEKRVSARNRALDQAAQPRPRVIPG